MPVSIERIVLPGSARTILSGAQVIGPVNEGEVVEATVKVRRLAPLPVPKALATMYSREELAAKHGASKADIDKVAKVFIALGLEVTDSNPAARTIKLVGPASAMEDAFGTKLFHYGHPTGSYRGRIGNIHIPKELDGIIVGVFGLDNRRQAHRNKNRLTLATSQTAHPSRPWFLAQELAALYQFPEGDGSGQTIGILEFDGAFRQDDLQKFCEISSVPNTATIIPLSVDHVSTVHDDEATGEVMLDIEIVAALCPKAIIPVYFGKFTEKGWIDVLDAAVHDNVHKPAVLSISWGFAEGQMIWTSAAMQQVNETLQEAALLGVTVCVASGDDGSGNQVDDGHAHVNFPASSPYVLSVGGTRLKGKNGKIKSEVVWGDGTRTNGGGSTGGGVSEFFPVPDWQKTLDPKSINPGNLPGRGVPDVCAVADAKTGYFVVTDGQEGISGGTSASAPLWAALIARVNAKRGSAVGYLTPILYKQSGEGTIGSQICRDITSGNNNTAVIGGYKAGKGWDAVTGWGSPIGAKLLDHIPSAP